MALASGLILYKAYLDEKAQSSCLATIRSLLVEAPLFKPVMPRTGKPFSVEMSNCGDVGWLSDKAGYRYAALHPDRRCPWPAIPPLVGELWDDLIDKEIRPEACLINYYASTARMGLHQDVDETAFAPVLSLSLGDTCVFRYGGTTRESPTRSVKLSSGDVVVLGGDARYVFHGVDRIISGSSSLLTEGGRFNLTVRRVTPFIQASGKAASSPTAWP